MDYPYIKGNSEEIFWKVLNVGPDGERRSAMVGKYLGGINYPLKEWVTPSIPNSVLMVFATKGNAVYYHDWISEIDKKHIIVPCYIVKSNIHITEICSSMVDIQKYWKNINNPDPWQWVITMRPLPGTIFAEKVFCTE